MFMHVLVYLISTPLSVSPDVGARDRATRILLGFRATKEGDEENLSSFSEILLGSKKGQDMWFRL